MNSRPLQADANSFLRSHIVEESATAPDDATEEVMMGTTEDSSHRELIVGGTVADPDAYPYFVDIGGYCGGSLIAPDIVLTAGHCKPVGRLSSVPVRVGAYMTQKALKQLSYFDPNASDGSETFEIIEAVQHSKFQRLGEDDFYYDYCLFKLKGQSSNPLVQINRDDNLPYPDMSVLAMGMGNMDGGRPSRPDKLRQVNLNVVKHRDCEAATSEDRDISYHGRIDPVSHMCTFGVGKDACSYDSGSPIILPRRNLLVGLVSWGEDCADEVFPGVNSRVSGVSDWIDETVCRLSDNPPKDFNCRHANFGWFSGTRGYSAVEMEGVHAGGSLNASQGNALGLAVVVLASMSVWMAVSSIWRRKSRDPSYTQIE